jgi:hypothetical protein
MSFLRFLLSRASAIAAIALITRAASAATCAPKNAEPVNAVREMYAGAMAGDRAKTIDAFDQNGFLFDGGERFTPEAITNEILNAEAAGTKFLWRIDGAESHTVCDLAWATWTNHGTFSTHAAVEHKTWLESAVFVWHDGVWKIRFFHSTPVRTPPTAS